MHPRQIQQWRLDRNRGPTSAAERFDEKVNYLGSPKKYKYFSKTVFAQELNAIQNGLHPLNATEIQFMDALEHTSIRMRHWSLVRRAGSSYEYRGPQSWIQRGDPILMDFEPQDREIARYQSKPSDVCVEFLQCNCCKQWRRVDLSTYNIYCNKSFNDD